MDLHVSENALLICFDSSYVSNCLKEGCNVQVKAGASSVLNYIMNIIQLVRR